MKNHLLILIATVFIMAALNVHSQSQYNQYDELPGIIKTYKPAYSDSYPDWAKMLYQEEINYKEIEKAYQSWAAHTEVEKSAILRYYKIWKRALADFVLPGGHIAVPDLKYYQENLRYAQLNPMTQKAQSNANWSFLGPKETFWLNESGSSTAPSSCPWQVNVYSFDVAESDLNTLYCGTETGFVNKSIDNGMSWQQMGLNYPFGGGVTAVVIHPNNAEEVYVSAGNQIHKTTDGGLSWIPLLEPGSQFHADRLEIDPLNPDKIIAAADNGIQISEDAGMTWERNWNIRCWDVAIQEGNSNRIFGITKSGSDFALVQSFDGGESYELDINSPQIYYVDGALLAVTPDNPDKLLILMLGPNPYLYQKDLSTEEWSLLAQGYSNELPMGNGQGYFDLVLEISPIDEDIVFVGTTTLYKSSNAGLQFHAIGGYSGDFSIHPDIQDMRLLADGNTWVATDGGFSYTSDNFTNVNNYFSRNAGLIGSDMWGFHQGWNEDIVVGGRYHNGNTAMADFYDDKALRMGGAESPTGWIIAGNSRWAAFNDLGNGWILPSTAEGQPEGRFIFSKYPNMDEYGGRRGNMVFHPNYYASIYLGQGDAVWKSIDGGESFDLLHNFGERVRYLDISYAHPEVLYADIVGHGLYKSEDGGYSWVPKPSLTSSQYGGANWKGKTHFVISPVDENVIYACLSNGTWSADIGDVFRSNDGGDTWEDWTGSIDEYTKCLVIQVDEDLQDIVYLFSNAKNGKAAKVFKRGEEDAAWESFDDGYPAGMYVNHAMPFYRDGKLRVGGTAGVWESPLEVEQMGVLVNPWVEQQYIDCMLDTLLLNDHSMMNHEGAEWLWDISPEPLYISDAHIRNPKVVLGDTVYYTISLSITKEGQEYSKTIPNMIKAGTCASIDDCNNPAELPKELWEVFYVDSEEVNYPGLAAMAIDGDPETIWHTRWSNGTDPYPHEIIVDMGEEYQVFNFSYLPRQDGENGRIAEYSLYVSENGFEWQEMNSSTFENTAAPQTIEFEESVNARFFKLKAFSEVNGNDWASAAEFSMVGCTDLVGIQKISDITEVKAFPIPVYEQLMIALPSDDIISYELISVSGQVLETRSVPDHKETLSIAMENFPSGVYFIRLQAENGIVYRVKVLKE